MQRYTIFASGGDHWNETWVEEVEAKAGAWVKHEDASAELAARDAEVKSLKLASEHWHQRVRELKVDVDCISERNGELETALASSRAENEELRKSVDTVLSCWVNAPDGMDAGGLPVALDELATVRQARQQKGE